MNFERCYMFTNKKLIRFGLSLFVFLGIINFTISYFQTYLETAADIKWVIPNLENYFARCSSRYTCSFRRNCFI